MRIEQKVSQALARLNNDRYVLSIAVGQRADELSKGAKPLLTTNTLDMKYTDLLNILMVLFHYNFLIQLFEQECPFLNHYLLFLK